VRPIGRALLVLPSAALLALALLLIGVTGDVRSADGRTGVGEAAVSFVADDLSSSNAPFLTSGQWALRKMHVDRAWDVARGSPELVVAVVDTGVDAGHPDLASVLLPGTTILTNVSAACQRTEIDDNSHGTHIAGIIGAAANVAAGTGGVAFGVRILPIKVLDCAGIGYASDIAKGIVWATDHGARIVNVSVGSPTDSDALASAVRYAEAHGVLVVAAAGNCGVGGGRCRSVNSAEYPAAFGGVVAVGATDADDDVPGFSTRGAQIAVVAPGVRIMSTTPRYATYQSLRGVTANYAAMSGTSQATAFVAGVAALVWSAEPRLDASDVAARLAAYADDLATRGRDDATGSGRVNALRALRQPTRVSSDRGDIASSRNVGIGASDADFIRSARSVAQGVRVMEFTPLP